MLGKLIDKLMKGPELKAHPIYTPIFDKVEDFVVKKFPYLYLGERISLKGCEEYEILKKLKAEEKAEAIAFLLKRTNFLLQFYKPRSRGKDSHAYEAHVGILDSLMRTKLDFPLDYSFSSFFDSLYLPPELDSSKIKISQRPFSPFATQIEKYYKRFGLTENLKIDIEYILASKPLKPYLKKENDNHYWGPDIGKAIRKLQQLLIIEGDDDSVPPFEFGTGRCGSLINHSIETLSDERKAKWFALFHHLHTASSGKPTQKFLKAAKPLVDTIGANEFKSFANNWFSALGKLPVETKTATYSYGQEYEYHEYIESKSFNLLKGLLWSMSRFHDQTSLQAISSLTEKCFQKLPGVGPAAAGVGNAGIYTLAESKGLGGISHLSRLKMKIRQNNTQKLIQKYIDEQAAKQGIKPAQVEEIAATDYGLVDGKRSTLFDDYQLILRLTAVGKTELQWIKPDGRPQKSVPAFVKSKETLKLKLAKFRNLAKQIKQASTTQRDRIDRLYTEGLSWSLDECQKYYVNHGLISQIAKKLIWQIDDNTALHSDGKWLNVKGEEFEIKDDAVITLWHPINSTTEEVLEWRDRLESLKIIQPLKQAYREIYILTDAEINTRVYSNRMAAHILKQHQFNSLAAVRGWKFQLMGAYDDGRDNEIARKVIPEHSLTAQFWIDEIIDDTDAFNDAGIWYYVATDQIRFCDNNDQPVPLIDVPKLVLSEIMRDADLFVGVASVGNDPQWQDGGPDGRQDYRDYWHGYSFGDLTEVAKTRKVVLERLLPRLKLKDVAKIDGKFLIVQGKKHKYKIHIGSGNILIAPTDRYLCIVPGRGKDKKVDNVFLPFEGDNGLSIVLSKAFLLADDDKITDPTILSQL